MKLGVQLTYMAWVSLQGVHADGGSPAHQWVQHPQRARAAGHRMRARRQLTGCFPAQWLPRQAGRLESRMLPLMPYPPVRVYLCNVLGWGA